MGARATLADVFRVGLMWTASRRALGSLGPVTLCMIFVIPAASGCDESPLRTPTATGPEQDGQGGARQNGDASPDERGGEGGATNTSGSPVNSGLCDGVCRRQETASCPQQGNRQRCVDACLDGDADGVCVEPYAALLSCRLTATFTCTSDGWPSTEDCYRQTVSHIECLSSGPN